MNFSLILNTRGRVAHLKRTLESFDKNTLRTELCEWLITADEDDSQTVDFLLKEWLPGRNLITGHALIGQRPKNLSVSLNHMALQAKGRFIFVLNDDSEMLTHGWDQIALKKFEAFHQHLGFKDGVVYGMTSDNSVDHVPNTVYACFPIISAEAVRALGFVMYPQIVALGGDSSIYRVYERIGRVVPMPEIQLDHIRHRTMQAVNSPDTTAREMRQNSDSYHSDPFGMPVDQEVEKLRRFIATFK